MGGWAWGFPLSKPELQFLIIYIAQILVHIGYSKLLVCPQFLFLIHYRYIYFSSLSYAKPSFCSRTFPYITSNTFFCSFMFLFLDIFHLFLIIQCLPFPHVHIHTLLQTRPLIIYSLSFLQFFIFFWLCFVPSMSLLIHL